MTQVLRDTSAEYSRDVSRAARPDGSATAPSDAFPPGRRDTSSRPRGDGSREASGDASAGAGGGAWTCAWCRVSLEGAGRRQDARTCSKRCRQALHRFGRGCVERARAATPLRLAYADPPYPGLARRYYQDHPDYAGEVDHRELLARLRRYDGWALSTSSGALPMVLSHARELRLKVRVAAWFRGERKTPSRWPLSAWEPVVYAGGRREVSREYSCDALIHRARTRTTDPDRVVGAKPAAFCWWLFELLGATPADTLDDLFPGSGGVRRAWALFVSRSTSRDGRGT